MGDGAHLSCATAIRANADAAFISALQHVPGLTVTTAAVPLFGLHFGFNKHRCFFTRCKCYHFSMVVDGSAATAAVVLVTPCASSAPPLLFAQATQHCHTSRCLSHPLMNSRSSQLQLPSCRRHPLLQQRLPLRLLLEGLCEPPLLLGCLRSCWTKSRHCRMRWRRWGRHAAKRITDKCWCCFCDSAWASA